jgi:2-dehydropantoate 2-reductase
MSRRRRAEIMALEPILIWGAGAIGGTLGAFWARAGRQVVLVDRVAEHVQACRTTGLTITGPVEAFTQIVPAATPAELTGTYRCIVLAVKAQATAAALVQLAPHLAEDGFVFSAQNGLNEIEIAAAVGAERTMGCFVNFGADWHGPGEILYGNRGALVVGEIDGTIRDRTRAMFALAQQFEPDAILTDDVWAYLWGKMSYGAMLFATALTHDSMTGNFADAARRPAFLALGREVAATAAAPGHGGAARRCPAEARRPRHRDAAQHRCPWPGHRRGACRPGGVPQGLRRAAGGRARRGGWRHRLPAGVALETDRRHGGGRPGGRRTGGLGRSGAAHPAAGPDQPTGHRD